MYFGVHNSFRAMILNSFTRKLPLPPTNMTRAVFRIIITQSTASTSYNNNTTPVFFFFLIDYDCGGGGHVALRFKLIIMFAQSRTLLKYIKSISPQFHILLEEVVDTFN